METFADVVNRLMPRTLSMARLSREANIEYSYFHALMQGHRTYIVRGEPVEKPLRASPEKGMQALDALERLGVRVTRTDRERMITACLAVPEGYRLVADPEDGGAGGESSEIEAYGLLCASARKLMTGDEKRIFGEFIEAWTVWKSRKMEEHKHAEEGGQQQECTA